MVRKCELLIIRLLLVFRPLQDDFECKRILIAYGKFVQICCKFPKKSFLHSEWQCCGARLNYTMFFMKSNPYRH